MQIERSGQVDRKVGRKMIVKIRHGSQWIYVADVRRVKTEEGQKDGKTMIDKLLLFDKTDAIHEMVELHGNPAYLLTNEGNTIERIN